jgi:hypothetical protein
VRGERRELEERRRRVEQRVDPLAGKQLPAGDVPGAGPLRASLPRRRERLPEVGDQRPVRLHVPRERRVTGVDRAAQHRGVGVDHGVPHGLILDHAPAGTPSTAWLIVRPESGPALDR